MMNARYKEVAQIGIYSKTGVYLEFKAGEVKEVTDEMAEELKNDSRFELTKPEAVSNEALPAKGEKKESKRVVKKDGENNR